MNFSETITHSGLVEVSPDSKYISTSRTSNLNIYHSKGAELVSSWPLPDIPSQVIWSPNSQFILTTHPKRNVVLMFSVENSEWKGKITMQPNGISGTWWSADSLHVCIVTEFQLRLSIWSLSDLLVYHIKNPKFEDKGFSFTSDGKFMLLAERSECKDYIGIYFAGDWQVVHHFSVETFDLEDAKWVNDSAIAIIDNCIVYQLLIYSPLGQVIARHRPYDNGLGIKCMSLSPNGTFLAVGSYDQSARIFSKISWRFLAEFEHKGENPNTHVYKEEEYKEGYSDDKTVSHYVVQNAPVKIPSLKVAKDKPNPPTGVSSCDWSYNSSYLATRNGNYYSDNNPGCVWVWSINSLSLNVLMIQLLNIKSLQWSPKSLHLAFCTGAGRIFIWSAEGASVCEVPLESKDFKVTKVKWTPDGTALVISDKNRFMMAYPKFNLLETTNEEYF